MEMHKILLIIPAVMIIASVAIIANNILTTGSFMERGVELTGGLSITIPVEGSVEISEIEALLPDASIRVAAGYETNLLVISTKNLDEEYVLDKIGQAVSFERDSAEIGRIEPVIGDIFWAQAQVALILAFLFMGVVVLFLFRAFLPSFTVLFAAVADIVVTVAVMSVIGTKLSLPVFAGFLMLIGYSIDTNILLTTRVLRGFGNIGEKIKSAVKTGITMTSTSIAALFSLFIFSQGTILQDIALVLMAGLVVDMINTWIMNAGILRIWLKRKGAEDRWIS